MMLVARSFFSNPAIRFLFCGGFAAGLNWSMRIGLSFFMPFAPAVAVAYLVSMVVGFGLYRTIVWPGHNSSLRDQVTGFILVNAASAVVVFGTSMAAREVLRMMVENGDVADAAAHAFGIALGAFSNYAGHRAFTFKGHH